MTDKERYRALCEAGKYYVPLFQQAWWMDTVCHGKQWDVLLARDGDSIVGAMPFLCGSKFGLTYIIQPQLTPWSGPWLHPDIDAERRKAVLDGFAREMRHRRPALFMQCFPPEVVDWQPFHWHGFRQTTRYTHRFPSLADPDALYRSASRLRRRYDKAVAEQCFVDHELSVDEFSPFHAAYYRRQGLRDLIAEPLLRRVVETSCSRGQGLLWGLRDHSSRSLQAAWFVAYDDCCAWSLLLAIGADAPHGAMSYLMWQMLRELSHRTQMFDFEGGMDEKLAFFYRSFGTEQVPYHCVYRSAIPFGERLLHL